MNITPKMEPCPWCKAAGKPWRRAVKGMRFNPLTLRYVSRTKYRVVCLNAKCAARGPSHETVEDAIKAWNKVAVAVFAWRS